MKKQFNEIDANGIVVDVVIDDVDDLDNSKPKKYKAKDGTEKVFWHTIGSVAMFDNDGSLKIPAFGLFNAKLYPVEEKTAPVEKPVTAPTYPEEKINPEDIPF